MGSEQSATRGATPDAAVAEKEPAAAKSPAAADPLRWEFRLTADGRRILIQVNRPTDPELV
jgi:hypothetical protein